MKDSLQSEHWKVLELEPSDLSSISPLAASLVFFLKDLDKLLRSLPKSAAAIGSITTSLSSLQVPSFEQVGGFHHHPFLAKMSEKKSFH